MAVCTKDDRRRAKYGISIRLNWCVVSLQRSFYFCSVTIQESRVLVVVHLGPRGRFVFWQCLVSLLRFFNNNTMGWFLFVASLCHGRFLMGRTCPVTRNWVPRRHYLFNNNLRHVLVVCLGGCLVSAWKYRVTCIVCPSSNNSSNDQPIDNEIHRHRRYVSLTFVVVVVVVLEHPYRSILPEYNCNFFFLRYFQATMSSAIAKAESALQAKLKSIQNGTCRSQSCLVCSVVSSFSQRLCYVCVSVSP